MNLLIKSNVAVRQVISKILLKIDAINVKTYVLHARITLIVRHALIKMGICQLVKMCVDAEVGISIMRQLILVIHVSIYVPLASQIIQTVLLVVILWDMQKLMSISVAA